MSTYLDYGYDTLGIKAIAEGETQYSAVEIDNLLENLSGLKLADKSVSVNSLRISHSTPAETLAIVSANSNVIMSFDVVPSKPFWMFAIPRFKIYVDTDNDPNYLFPYGPSLSGGQTNCVVSTWMADEVDYTANTDNVRLLVTLHLVNFDSSGHTYYIHNGWRYVDIT